MSNIPWCQRCDVETVKDICPRCGWDASRSTLTEADRKVIAKYLGKSSRART